MAQKFEYTILDMIESASKVVKTTPLNLGGTGGLGGGVGAPPGGFIGQLPQYRVAYDTLEAATAATLPSGVTGISGWSLVDNLNHIRYRIGVLESGGVIGSGTIIVKEYDGSPTVSDVNTIIFSGATVLDMGGGQVLVSVAASSGGGGDSTYLRLDASNDPITGTVEIVPATQFDPALFIDGLHTAAIMRLDQHTVGNPPTVINPVIFLYRTPAGGDTTDFNSPFIQITGDDSTGIITGDFISAEHNNVVKFNIDIDGHAYDNGGLLVTDAPSNGLTYGRKDAGWVTIGSGGSGLSEAEADLLYLRLDTSNDPLTAQLDIVPTANGDGGIYIETTGDAFTADFEQLTVGDNIGSPTILGVKVSTGAGNIPGDVLQLWMYSTGAGVVTGDFVSLNNQTTQVFNIDKDGHAYDNGNILLTDAPSDGSTYGRNNGAWVVASGVVSSGSGTALTVREYDGSPSVSNVDTIVFSGLMVTDLGSGDVQVSTQSHAARLLYLNGGLVINDFVINGLYPYAMSTEKATGGPYTSSTSGIGNTTVLLSQYITDGISSGFVTISKGTFRVYCTLSQTAGTRAVTAYAKISKVNTSGTVTLLTTTASTPTITGSAVMYEMASNDGPFTLSISDKILVEIYAVGGASGTNATISAQDGNTDGERLELPSTNNIEWAYAQFGWIPVTQVWTRTGNFTFTVPGDKTSIYRKGAKVRYKDGGAYEYGVIGSSVYTSLTTVTLITNSDYAMAAATITDTYLSYTLSPVGFPGWFNWAPTYSASGSMTYTSVSTTAAKWKTDGNKITAIALATGTTGGTASTSLQASAPIAEVVGAATNPASYADGGASSLGFSFVLSSKLNVRKADSSNYGLGASRTMNCTVTYEF